MSEKNAGNSYAVPASGNSHAPTEGEPRRFSSPLTEALLETAIEVAKQHLCDAPTRQEKLDAWREMCRLIDQRTPHRVRFNQRMREIA